MRHRTVHTYVSIALRLSAPDSKVVCARSDVYFVVVLTTGNVYFYYTPQGLLPVNLIYIIMSSNRQPTGSHSYTNKNKTTNQTGSHSPLDFSDNENDWQTVTNESSKCQRSSNTLSSPLPKKDTSIFISSNRFSPLAPPNEESQMDTNNIEQSQKVTLPKTVNPPPIFIESNLNFNNFTAKIKELTQPVGFECKTSTKGVKLQTFNSDSYRSVVKFLKESQVSFH